MMLFHNGIVVMVSRRGRSRLRIVIAALLLSTAGIPAAVAQKAPGLGYVFPPAVRAGETTAVQFGGFDFTDDLQWFIYDEAVQLNPSGPPGEYFIPPPPYWSGPRTSTPALPIPREISGSITVAMDAPEQLVRWQVANASGSSETAMLYISRGMEVLEHRSRDLPQQLPKLPVGVSGRLSRLTEVDQYLFKAEHDGLVTVDLMARRLGADFHGVLQVHNADGKILADFADTLGLDGNVVFAVTAGETYRVSLHDADFRGDRSYVYRLGISQTITKNDQLSTNRQTTEAIALSDAPLLINAPGFITGQFPTDVNEHRYTWNAQQHEHWSIALQSRALGSRMDVALAILDPSGTQIAENDDLPGTTDAGLAFQATTEGIYTAVVRRLSGSGSSQPRASGSATSSLTANESSTDVYRLQLHRPAPDFSLSVPQRVTLPLGGKSDVTVKAERHGGFAEVIQVAVEGLPAGVSIVGDGVIAADKHEVKLTFESAADAEVTATVLRFHGNAVNASSAPDGSGQNEGGQNEGGQRIHPALATAAGNLCPRKISDQQISQVLLAITMPAPFEIQVVDRERQNDVHRGTTFLAKLEIVRKQGFAGEIELQMSAQQARYRAGIRGGIVQVGRDATQALYPCFMPEWLGTELTRRMVVHGVARIPDPKGNLRCVTMAADSRITMIMEGALLKLTSDASELTCGAGDKLQVPFKVTRSAKLPLKTTVELIAPEEIASLLHAEPLQLKPDQNQGTLIIESIADVTLNGTWTLTLRATSMQDDKWPVVSEMEIPVVFTVVSLAKIK